MKASDDFKTTDEALKYFNETHPELALPDEPNFTDYYRPGEDQKPGELIYVGGGMLAIGYLASRL